MFPIPHPHLNGCDLGLSPRLVGPMRRQDMLGPRTCARISATQCPWAARGGWGRAEASPLLRGQGLGACNLGREAGPFLSQAAGRSKIQHPKGVASSGLAFQDIQSDRWDQQQGILGLRPTQKSRRAGIGLLRSVFQGEDPFSWEQCSALGKKADRGWGMGGE